MIWDQLTSEETKKINRTTPVVILLCATEQHGPHLPLSTDRLIGEHFLHEINRLMEKEVILLPVIPIGYSEHHMDFSGSLTFQHATFKTIVEEMVRSMIVHEFKNFIFLNSHGGNQGIGQVILESLGNKHSNCQFSFMTWWKIVGDELKKINKSGSGSTGHAGEFETSLMLYIAPDLVRKDHLKSWSEPQLDPLVGDMVQAPKFSFFQTIQQISANGVVGNPSLSSKEQGEKISQIVTAKLVALIKSCFF